MVEKLRCNVLHNLGCAVAAYTAGEEIWATLRDRAPAEATLLCDGGAVAAEHAAFANAALMHTRAQDDTHFAAKTHVGAAMSRRRWRWPSASGGRAPTCVAVVAGCEVAAAVGERLARGDHRARLPRDSGVRDARRRRRGGLDPGPRREQHADAIAIASSFSGGLNQTWIDGTSEYRLQLGMAARNGIAARDAGGRRADGARATGTRATPGSRGRSPA